MPFCARLAAEDLRGPALLAQDMLCENEAVGALIRPWVFKDLNRSSR